MTASGAMHPHDLATGHYSVHTNRQALARGEAHIAALWDAVALATGATRP